MAIDAIKSSSGQSAGPPTDPVVEAARALLGEVPQAARPVLLGGNNRIYRLECGGRSVALKFYPRQDSDPRDRLGVEYEALEFLAAHGVTSIPRPLACDRGLGCAAYEWIEGERIVTPSPDEIGALAGFLARLHGLRLASGAGRLRPASASCFAPAQVEAQLRFRRIRLDPVLADEPALARFLAERFDPLAAAVLAGMRRRLGGGEGWERPLAEERRTLSPSDFGFHNALRRGAEVIFLDFEYFGWDDPVKATCDVMLHPGTGLDENQADRFLQAVRPVFVAADPGFDERLDCLYPAFALIWCLILLNEFLPDSWARRIRPGISEDRRTVLSRQLEKAERLHQRIVSRHGPSSFV